MELLLINSYCTYYLAKATKYNYMLHKLQMSEFGTIKLKSIKHCKIKNSILQNLIADSWKVKSTPVNE